MSRQLEPTPDRPHADQVTGSRDQVRSTRAYLAELLRQEQSRAGTASNDNTNGTERFLADYMRAYEEREARLPLPSVPRSGRRSLPAEVRAARRRLYVTGCGMLALWLTAIVSPILAHWFE
jgi:hypothetical protein